MKELEYISDMMGVEEADSNAHFDLDSTMLESVKDWKVGAEYTLTLTVRTKSLSEVSEGVVSSCNEVISVTQD